MEAHRLQQRSLIELFPEHTMVAFNRVESMPK